MEKILSGRKSFRNSGPRLRAGVLGVLSMLVLTATASAQEIMVSGTVTSPTGSPLREVLVRVQGGESRTLTDATGRYSLRAPSDGVLSFSLLGRRAITEQIAGRTTVNVTMDQVPYLEEVVVTAYTEQRRADITGAVSGVNLETTERQTGASVLQRLDATAPGVTVVNSGSPGSRSTVRIRGISSFQNNDPLYIVDGVPVQDSYMNFLNPNDITSVQVLKDASAASIYGARANNGVVVIETTKKGAGGPPKVTLRARVGTASPVRGYDDMLITNALDYHAVMREAYRNAGERTPTNIYGDSLNPSIPAYFYAEPVTVLTRDAWGRPATVDMSKYSYPTALIMPGSEGTNWWDATFGSAPVQDYHAEVAGGSDVNTYRVSFNYFDQGGTARYNNFKRGSVRVNTLFNRGRLNFGENIAVALQRHHGGLPADPPDYAEDGILGKNILLQPVVPVYDINGNFAGGKTGAINQGNPLKFAYARKDDENRVNQVFGNVFAGLDVAQNLGFKSTLGFNLSQSSFVGFTPPRPEDAEASFNNTLTENRNHFTDWTWSNTLRYSKVLSDRHSLAALVGQEANASTTRYIEGALGDLLNTDLESRYIQDALGTGAKNVLSTGGRSALLSFFGKVDYNFADKYVASFTIRRDGSSRLAPGNQWGTFPAFGLGWRMSNESFLANNGIFSDVMLRLGWGITGNQFIPPGRIVAQFGGSRGDTYYDVSGSNSSVVGGYRQTALGNPNLKWEENKSTNIGADLVLFEGLFNVVVDVYRRQTENLLFDPRLPATAGEADPPIINVGKMKNTGIDFSIGHEARSWSVTLNASHYKNEIVSIDGETESFVGELLTTRFGDVVINQVGHPIGSFYGYIADGFFRDAADVASHATQAGKAPGRMKFRDVNGDRQITLADRTIVGDPHPDLVAGLDLTARRGNWDVSATVFGTFGNDIWENQKEFYVFREFNTNVKKDLLANSWTPENPNAKYPKLDKNDTFSWQPSSYYVEDGSYVRLRSVQLGYAIPTSLARWFQAGSRVYVQAENLFTITGYEGLDPSLPAANVTGAAGDVRDQYRGVDRGSYPSNKVFAIGVVTSF
jgi:TonB-dependent starch-binding outer membrane protein SusC